jgi:hypothetical protein
MSNLARIRSAQVAAVTVTSSATLLVTTDPTDRASVAVRNLSLTQTLYLGFAEADADPTIGWPIRPLEIWSADVASGVPLWAVSDGDDIDVRVLQGIA